MPKKGRRPRRSRGSGRTDFLHFPLLFGSFAGTSRVTTIDSIKETFDRSRAFRIAMIRGEISAAKYPVPLQIEAYSPVNTSNNTWTSPVFVIPTGVVRKFTFRIPPASTQWYPALAATTTTLLQLNFICGDKNYIGYASGVLTLTIEMRPYEMIASCPALMLDPAMSTPCSSSSVSVLEESSDDEYFST